MAYLIAEDDCIACGACAGACPVSCIAEADNGKYRIDAGACIDCGQCEGTCPVTCITAG